jgi:hypothetical protein
MSGITWPSAKKNWNLTMNEKPVNTPMDHHLANRQNRELKLRSQRSLILKMDAEIALDAVLDAPSPATLVQSFPDQDLYFLMHRIGPSDFIPVLSWQHPSSGNIFWMWKSGMGTGLTPG